MTTLYRPETIKTVARADALPGGTFIRLSVMYDSWTRLLAPEDRDPHEADDVPFLALVPIEAEEETSVVVKAAGFQDIATHPYSEASMDSEGNVWFGDGLNKVDVSEEFNEWAKEHTRRRLVTPWEPA